MLFAAWSVASPHPAIAYVMTNSQIYLRNSQYLGLLINSTCKFHRCDVVCHFPVIQIPVTPLRSRCFCYSQTSRWYPRQFSIVITYLQYGLANALLWVSLKPRSWLWCLSSRIHYQNCIVLRRNHLLSLTDCCLESPTANNIVTTTNIYRNVLSHSLQHYILFCSSYCR